LKHLKTFVGFKTLKIQREMKLYSNKLKVL